MFYISIFNEKCCRPTTFHTFALPPVSKNFQSSPDSGLTERLESDDDNLEQTRAEDGGERWLVNIPTTTTTDCVLFVFRKVPGSRGGLSGARSAYCYSPTEQNLPQARQFSSTMRGSIHHHNSALR